MSETSRNAACVLWRFRFVLCAAALLATFPALWAISTLGVSNSLEVWYPENDPLLAEYRDFQRTYGSDEIIVVAVSRPAGFGTEEGRERVGEVTDALLDVEGVATVTSLVTVPESLATARGRLLSDNQLTTALVVQTLVGEDAEARRHQLILDIRATVAGFGYEPRLAGYGVVFDGLNEASTTGATSLITTAHLVMIGLLTFLFRRLGPVVLTLAAVGCAATWTMGLYAWTGHQLNMVTMVLPTLVLVIGIADCLHILRSVAAQPEGDSQEERVVNGLAAVVGPCTLMSITTAAGFLGLTTSGLPVVQQLGWFGAVGMLSALATSFTIVTAGLSSRRFEPGVRRSRLDDWAPALSRAGSGRPGATITIFAVLCIASLYGVSQLNSDTDSIGYLKPSHVIRQDSDFIESRIGPYVPVEFTVTADGDILQAGYLDAIWRWQQRAQSLPQVGWSWSLIDALATDGHELPSDAGMDVLSARFDRMQRFSPVVANAMISGGDTLRVSFGAPIMSARSVQSLIADILDAAELPDGLAVRPAGYSPLYTRIVDEIVDSQVRGFSTAMVMIVALLGIAMRSWRRLLLALPANAIPVLFTLGLMGLTGIPLDVASATIASVILGLVVDDTVHLLRPYAGADVRRSLEKAARGAGGTLVMTSLVLATGLLVLGLAEIRSIAWFGILASFAVVVAILSDLTLIPALANIRNNVNKNS